MRQLYFNKVFQLPKEATPDFVLNYKSTVHLVRLKYRLTWMYKGTFLGTPFFAPAPLRFCSSRETLFVRSLRAVSNSLFWPSSPISFLKTSAYPRGGFLYHNYRVFKALVSHWITKDLAAKIFSLHVTCAYKSSIWLAIWHQLIDTAA